MTSKRRLPPGFTLIEILCVIGILAVLIAILLPCLASSRKQAQRQTCLSNIRQLDLALIQYTQDYDSTYPPGTQSIFDSEGNSSDGAAFWSDLLDPYIQGDFPHCPGIEMHKAVRIEEANSGYAFNGALAEEIIAPDKSYAIGRPEAAFSLPSLTISLLEAHIGVIETTTPDTEDKDAKKGTLFGAIRHGGGANYAFLDGHAKWYRPSDLAIICDENKPCFQKK